MSLLLFFYKSFVHVSLSDGMTVFSPVSSARYRRSSVSINPSCPSQVSVFNIDDEVPLWFRLSLTCWRSSIVCVSSPPAAPPSLTFLLDWRQTWSEEAGEDRKSSDFFLLHNISLFVSFHSDDGTNHTHTRLRCFHSIITGWKWTWKSIEWLYPDQTHKTKSRSEGSK